jgi:sec-independent protein translocase protein TatC
MAKPQQQSVMPLGDHLEELRRRLLVAIYGLLPIVVVSLVFGKKLLEFLIGPAQEALRQAGQSPALQEVAPLETFSTYMRVSVIAAVIVGSPWLLYQLWLFVAPGLYSREKRYVYLVLPMSAALTATGVFFLYRFIMPMVMSFFLAFGSSVGTAPVATGGVPEGVSLSRVIVLDADPVHPQPGDEWINRGLMQRRVCLGVKDGVVEIASTQLDRGSGITPHYRISEYIKLLLSLSLAFAAGFQTPVVVLVLGWAGFLTPETIGKYRRHAIFACAVAAALLTPGDPGSMIALMIPLWLLYELGGLMLRVLPSERMSRAGKDEHEDDRDVEL